MVALTFISFFALLASTAVNAIPSTTVCLAELCLPDDLSTPVIDAVAGVPAGAKIKARHGTNAHRFARGLPPAPPPTRRQSNKARVPAASPAPGNSFTGYIEVFDSATSASLGYISATPLGGIATPVLDISLAQKVSFSLSAGATSGTGLNITPVGSLFTSLGLIRGRDSPNTDIGAGTWNYGYVSLTNEVAFDSVAIVVGNLKDASYPSESAVWSIDTVTLEISLQWINSDGSRPATKLFSQSNALYFGGDSAAFLAKYPSPIKNITLKLAIAV